METTLPAVSFAFQPIIDVNIGRIVSFEALVRGVNNESAWEIIQQVRAEDMYRFDEEL